jgi:hypothetical protein
MNPTYQQAMVQQLMGSQYAAPGMSGQNASSPYGQNFITGNQMSTPGMLGTAPPGQTAPSQQQMAQPMATY